MHKAVSVGTTMHIIEELQVFPAGQPVRHLLLDADRVSRVGSLGSGLGVPRPPAPAGWRDLGSGHELSECGGGRARCVRSGSQEVALWGAGAGACLPCCVSLAGIAVRCLTLERGQGACGQLQPVPELRGLPPGPRPVLRLERLEVCIHHPLPAGGGLQVRARSGPFPLSLLAHPPPSASALDPLESPHSLICVCCLDIIFFFL